MKRIALGTKVRVLGVALTLTGTVVSHRIYRHLITGVKWPGYLVFLDRDDYAYKLAGLTQEKQQECRRFVNLGMGLSVLFVHAENLEVRGEEAEVS